MAEAYLVCHDNRRDDSRREALLRLGHALIKVKNDLAFFPSKRLDSQIRDVLVFCIAILKEFEVKTLRQEFLDEGQDIYPLANLYNLGIQILALQEIQNRFFTELDQWKYDVEAVQASSPGGSDDIGTVLAEVHEFLVFATLTNRIHPFHILTEFSIKHAVQVAKHSEFLTEASNTISILAAALSIQNELDSASGPKNNRVVSSAIIPPQTVIHIAKDWYKSYKSSISVAEKEFRREAQLPMIPFNRLFTWFIDARRRIISVGQIINPALKMVVNDIMASKVPFKHSAQKLTPMKNKGDEPHYDIPLTELILELLGELGEMPKLILLKHSTVDPPLPRNRSPIFFNLFVNMGADGVTQETQNLLKKIYNLFNMTAYRCLEVIQRAHWVNMEKQYEYAVRAKKEIDKNYLRAAGIALATRRLNTVHFEEEIVCRKSLVEQNNRNPFLLKVLDAVFEICNDPNMLEEEYLAYVTGLSVTQVHSWCKESLSSYV